MSDLTHLNPTGRFTGLAELYARCRPSYPAAAIDFIAQQGQLRPGDTVADIGCGTGISSRLLAERGLRVVGIEPNADMRAAAMAEITTNVPEYRDGQAENTGLPTGSCQAVLSAQAFHWFKPDDALCEFHRILVPGGWAFLMWNERDSSDAFTAAYGAIVRQGPNAHEVESKRSGEILLTHPLYRDAQLRQFTNAQALDFEGLLGRALSVSYAPREAAAAERYRGALLNLFQRHGQQGHVTLRYQTLLYCGARR